MNPGGVDGCMGLRPFQKEFLHKGDVCRCNCLCGDDGVGGGVVGIGDTFVGTPIRNDMACDDLVWDAC